MLPLRLSSDDVAKATPMRKTLPLMLVLILAGCDKFPMLDPSRALVQKEAEGKAIGGACRHAGRALEDCYTLNPKASKAAVFAGWREMNDYMTEKQIEVVTPTIPPRMKNAKSAVGGAEQAESAAPKDKPDDHSHGPEGATDKASTAEPAGHAHARETTAPHAQAEHAPNPVMISG